MLVDLLYQLVFFIVACVWLFFDLCVTIRNKRSLTGWRQRWLGAVPKLEPVADNKKRIWLHGVSVGEVNLFKTIVKELEATRPNWEFVVSTWTPTGFELAQKLFADKTQVFYCPVDLKFVFRRALKRIKPDMLVHVESEIWPMRFKAAQEFGARVAIVNGRVSASSVRRYRRGKRLMAPTFRRIDLVAAQDELAARYFREFSPCPERVAVTGSIKFDGVTTDRNNSETTRFGSLVGVDKDDVVFLAGSTQSPEEAGALETYRRLYREYPRLKLILVPRHPRRFEEVATLLDASEFAWTRRSTLAPDTSLPPPTDPSPERDPRRVILVDTIGELGGWWGLAKIAFVGGSWGGRDGQNMLEPSGYGAAVSFGPKTKNFQKIVEALLKSDGAVVVANVDEMEHFTRRCLADPEYRDALGRAARDLAIRNAGATHRTLEELAKLLED